MISKIFDRKKGADLYGFLYYLGYTDNIDACWNNVKQKNEFDKLSVELCTKDDIYYRPKIVSIIEKYLGKGKRVGDTTPDQAEFIFLILNEIKDELVNK